jgi:DNA repair photolyase
VIAFSGNTDCYHPIEAVYELTRKCLQVCVEYRNPVAVITKSKLIRRDLELLAALHREASCRVAVSIPFKDDETARKIEPYASSASKRFETLRMLSEAGIPTTLALAPVIPGLNDSDIPELLERARDAGARSAFMVLLRLPREVLPVFDERLEQAFPLRAAKIRNAIKSVRGGKMYRSGFGERMSGEGERWAIIEQLFATHRRRLGLEPREDEPDPPATFRRPTPQLTLF